jgi:hypothetical protein
MQVLCKRLLQASSLALATDSTVHIVLDDFGSLGRAYRETDEVQSDEQAIIENLLGGEYSRPRRVIAFNAIGGWARDATADIARAVLKRAIAEEKTLPEATCELIEGELFLALPASVRSG